MSYLFTCESVSEGHPDKIADQISDGILDYFLALDSQSKVACETLVTTGQVIIAGEVKSNAYVDVQRVSREVIRQIGYTKSDYMFDADSCGILSAIHEQSPEINQGVDRNIKEEQGAGDQGMMFGYATNETEAYLPLPLYLSHKIVQKLAELRKEKKQMAYLRPDAKAQVTIRYNEDHMPKKIDSIVVSTQHDPFSDDENMHKTIVQDVKHILIKQLKAELPESIQRLFKDDTIYHINPTGKFIIGGPHGDTGLTGRKIIVDTYGGKGAHGGGAFSGKDPSKVDRSAAYMARYIAKNMVAAGIANEVLVQISYAIGLAKPVGFFVNTYNGNKTKFSDAVLAEKVQSLFDLRPYGIEKILNLREPIYLETAAYGHMGRTSKTVTKTFKANGHTITKTLELFPWEKLDQVEPIKKLIEL